ncbi:hypothetical protein WH47_07904 [Habropoda laboriosa]|uniref:Uncharacterized protein n=1 Tax=Habropoda laboriosa TaxID=597456 RepID=A0A0L7RFG3_9HYME|nr:hypothetical protein WH47_07904 [Habropoda laboriosa]
MRSGRRTLYLTAGKVYNFSLYGFIHVSITNINPLHSNGAIMPIFVMCRGESRSTGHSKFLYYNLG